MTKLLTKITTKLNISNMIAAFRVSFPNLFTISFWKFKILVLSFTIAYAIFLIIATCFIYKTYLDQMYLTKDYIIQSMSIDLSNFKINAPKQNYVHWVPSSEMTDAILRKVGAIDYKDYIYNISRNSRKMSDLFQHDIIFRSYVNSAVLTDMLQHNAQLLADLGEEAIRRVFRLTLPLAASTLILGMIFLVENTQLLAQAVAV